MEKGFIKAEVIQCVVLIEKKGSLARCREEGLIRMEGKEYIVHDGDSIYFHFYK
jgi:ribosome-binding ATPase YchF (GTP1/OBG family)